MKKPLRALVFLVAALAALLLWNTYRRGPLPRAIGVAPPAGERLDEQAIAEHLAAAVRFRTVSHQDPKDDDPAIFAAFREFLESTYPKVHATMKRELVNENGLLYRWEGSDRSLSPEEDARCLTQRHASAFERHVRRYPGQWYAFREMWAGLKPLA